MLHGKKYILLIVGVVIIVVIIVNIKKNDPQNVIEQKIKIKLPLYSKVINYSYDKDGGYFDAKILIDEQNINNLKEQLSKSIGTMTGKKFPSHINFENTCSWWDLNKGDIIESYSSFVSGEKRWFRSSPKTHEVWAFISKEMEGQYYLYISY